MNAQMIEQTIDFLVRRLPSIGDITEDEFSEMIQDHLRLLDYGYHPDDWTHDLRSYITPNHHASVFEVIPCLSTLRLVDFQRYCCDYFKQIHVEVLIQGNVEREQAIDVVNRLLNGVKWGKIDDVRPIL